MATLTITEVDDEARSYEWDGNDIITTTHDEHGWDGMKAVDKSLRTLAGLLGADIVEK